MNLVSAHVTRGRSTITIWPELWSVDWPCCIYREFRLNFACIFRCRLRRLSAQAVGYLHVTELSVDVSHGSGVHLGHRNCSRHPRWTHHQRLWYRTIQNRRMPIRLPPGTFSSPFQAPSLLFNPDMLKWFRHVYPVEKLAMETISSSILAVTVLFIVRTLFNHQAHIDACTHLGAPIVSKLYGAQYPFRLGSSACPYH